MPQCGRVPPTPFLHLVELTPIIANCSTHIPSAACRNVSHTPLFKHKQTHVHNVRLPLPCIVAKNPRMDPGAWLPAPRRLLEAQTPTSQMGGG